MTLRHSIKLGLFSTLFVVFSTGIAADSTKSSEGADSDPVGGIYRNVNEDGVVEFSDQGNTSSKKIKLKTTNTFKAAPKKIQSRETSNKSYSESSTKAASYSELAISSPTPDQQIRSNNGDLTVSIMVAPSLAKGDQLELYYDGVSQGKQQGSVFNLKDVYRGQHRVQAKIISKSGKVLKISKPVQFVIHKYSALFIKNTKPKLKL